MKTRRIGEVWIKGTKLNYISNNGQHISLEGRNSDSAKKYPQGKVMLNNGVITYSDYFGSLRKIDIEQKISALRNTIIKPGFQADHADSHTDYDTGHDDMHEDGGRGNYKSENITELVSILESYSLGSFITTNNGSKTLANISMHSDKHIDQPHGDHHDSHLDRTR